MADADAPVPAVNLRILSPSPELDGGINLAQLPTSTTVADLRRRIQDAVPSRPAPDHMRLIYRGKVVADDASTLVDVFGADNLRQSPNQSLHLVLRELPATAAAASAASASTSASPTPRSATAPNALPTSPSLATNPFRALPRPSSQPPLPHHHHHHHHPHHHHHVQQPLNPLAANPVPATNPMSTIPLPPNFQTTAPMPPHIQQLANTLAGAPPNPLVPGAPASQPPNSGAIRQEGIGPNGERWSVTINDFTANAPLRPGQPMMPRPVPFPAPFRIPPRPTASPASDVSVPVSWLLPRLRDSLREATLEMANVNTLLQMPTSTSEASLPQWRIQRVRGHLRTVIHSMQMAETALSNPVLQLNTDVIAMRQSAVQLRRRAEEINASLDRQQISNPATTQPQLSQSPQTSETLPPDASPELFILSSPQGPVGVLFDQRGTYTTAPLVPTAPMPNFSDQYIRNRQLIAGLSHQITRSTLASQLNALRPTPTQASHNATQDQNQTQGQDGNQNQGQNQNQPQNQNQNGEQNQNPDGENDRMMNIGGHLWLVFKLACFVYIFAGGGGWYRPIILAVMAACVYLAQLGIFNDQLNMVRRHFEALLPNTDRLVQGHEAAAPQPRPGARNMTPEEAARRILQQHQQQRFSWARDTMRTLERSVAIFVASLWPGIGERMVHAQEERVRAERAAEEEEAQRAEEQRRIEAEAQQKEAEESAEKSAETGADETSEVPTEKSQLLERENEAVPGADEEASAGASAKGKERAETAA
jgi:hypothetical protein